jgi:hypothetical protein
MTLFRLDASIRTAGSASRELPKSRFGEIRTVHELLGFTIFVILLSFLVFKSEAPETELPTPMT